MKKHFTIYVLIILSVLLSVSSEAQILNAGFEQWTDGQPNDWLTSNIISVINPITRSSTSNSGSFALRGEILSLYSEPYTAMVMSGTHGEGFSVSQRYASLKGYYQFSPVGGDELYVAVSMWRDDDLIGMGIFTTNDEATSYTLFNADIEYISNETPDMCDITISIGNPEEEIFHIGSVMLIDDLSFSGSIPSAVENGEQSQLPEQFSIRQNYPNPFNPVCTIEYTVPEISMVTIKVYNTMGSVVATLYHGLNGPGVHKVNFQPEQLSSGVYLYKMSARSMKSGNTFVEIKKALYSK